jgi:hypothetical protein
MIKGMRPLLWALMLGVGATVGCDDGPAGNDENGGQNGLEPGTFSATVTGAVTASLEGGAAFASDPSGNPGFALVLTTLENNPDQIVASRIPMGRPAAGEYAIVELTNPGQDFWGWLGLDTTTFNTESGTLRITTSSAGEVAGELEFEGMSMNDSNANVTVTVEFRAKCAGTGNVCE